MSSAATPQEDAQKALDRLTNELVQANDSLIKAREAVQSLKDQMLGAQQTMLTAADALLQSNERLNSLKINLLNQSANHWKAKAEAKTVHTEIVEHA